MSDLPNHVDSVDAGAECSGCRNLWAEVRRLKAERDKLQAFKDWTHQYLDAQGVPHHPPGVHGAEGCRVGDRMDWLMAERDRLRAALVGIIGPVNDELRREGPVQRRVLEKIELDARAALAGEGKPDA